MGEKEILKILQETQDFDYENLVKVWNSYCEERGYLEDKIYVFSFTDDMLFDCAINIYSLAIYIANFDEAKQQEILDELF